MNWYQLYKRIGKQNIGHTQRNKINVFIDGKQYIVSSCIYENGKLIGLKCEGETNEQ